MATTVYFTTGKQASPKHSGTMLDPFAQLFQHCLGNAHVVYKVLWVVSLPRCTVGPNIVRSCSVRILFLTVRNVVRRILSALFFTCFDNKKTCLNNRLSNGIQRPFLSPTPIMVYTKETTTHSKRIIHTQLFA